MIEVRCSGPFDLGLSLQVARSFDTRKRVVVTDSAVAPPSVLRLGVWLDERPTLIEARQVREMPAILRAEAKPAPRPVCVRDLVGSVVNAPLDLGPFYDLAAGHDVLGPLTRELHGVKPLRPAGLFDMLVMAITEQQISLSAAHHIQTRLVERFGAEVEGIAVFPRPEVLADASVEALMACGMSRRKAEYVTGVAREVTTGTLDLGALDTASDDEVRSRLSSLRGFGAWSANYVLVRGLGRPDAVPVDDLAVRSVLGRALGTDHRLAPAEVEEVLAPFTPYRGLATFYFLAADRRTRQ